MNEDKFDHWLAAEAERLPRAVEPSRDLWPGIEARLGEVGQASLTTHKAPRPALWHWGALAATIATIAIGALFALRIAPDAPVRAAGPEVVADAVVETPIENPPPASPNNLAADAFHYASYTPDYRRTRDELLVGYTDELERLSPATREIVEKNLLLIQDSLVEIRAALADDSENLALYQLLSTVQQKELALLTSVRQLDLEKYDL